MSWRQRAVSPVIGLAREQHKGLVEAPHVPVRHGHERLPVLAHEPRGDDPRLLRVAPEPREHVQDAAHPVGQDEEKYKKVEHAHGAVAELDLVVVQDVDPLRAEPLHERRRGQQLQQLRHAHEPEHLEGLLRLVDVAAAAAVAQQQRQKLVDGHARDDVDEEPAPPIIRRDHVAVEDEHAVVRRVAHVEVLQHVDHEDAVEQKVHERHRPVHLLER